MTRSLRNTWVDFLQTRWSLIARLVGSNGDAASEQGSVRPDAGERSASANRGIDDGGSRCEVLDELVRVYWSAVYGFLRRSGLSRDEAEEVTQGFFADVVIGRGLFERANSDRGRLRDLLIRSLRNYQVGLHRRASSRSRGGLKRPDGRPVRLVPHVSIESEERRLQIERSEDLSPEEMFDRRLALGLIEEALEDCRRHYEHVGKPGHWQLFEECLLRPATLGHDRPPMAELAVRHGFASAAAASAALQVVCQRVVSLMRAKSASGSAGHDEAESRFISLMQNLRVSVGQDVIVNGRSARTDAITAPAAGRRPPAG